MAAVPIKIEGVLSTQDGTATSATLVGLASYPDLEVGGGPINPDDVPHPEHPIVIPPDVPPTDAHPEHPIVLPPETTPPPGGGEGKPPLWLAVWIPGYGWISVPAFPHPTPSKRR